MLEIGFLVWETKKNKGKGRYKIIYEWEKLEKFYKGQYTKEIYKYIKFIEKNKYLAGAVHEFRQKFPLKETVSDILSLLSSLRNQDYLPPRDGWDFNLLLSSKKRLKAAFFIAKFMAKHQISVSMRSQLESIFYCGFVDVKINHEEKPITIDIPDETDRDFGFLYRSPVIISLNSANLTKKEVKNFIDREWPRIKAYFEAFPEPAEYSISERDFILFNARKKGKKYREILETLASAGKDISLDEYDSNSVENMAEIAYRSRKKMKDMCQPKSITKK